MKNLFLFASCIVLNVLNCVSCSSQASSPPTNHPTKQQIATNNGNTNQEIPEWVNRVRVSDYQVTVSGEGVTTATKNSPLVLNITIPLAELNKLVLAHDSFAMLGYKTELLKNAFGKADGAMLNLQQKNALSAKYGFQDKDVITNVDKTAVRSLSTINKIFALIAKNGNVSLTLKRGFTVHKIVLYKGK
ncbi:MAG: hypothetical protein LBE20_07135 [Deltaproteobacteria bacterium]|jgi:hypothetical protein|nr:hypothetical protein [Deltaproteobacteria bacterium]